MTNQLALFASVDQQAAIDKQVMYKNKNAEQRLARYKLIEDILKQNNFIENIHYKMDAVLVDKEVQNATLYDKNRQEFKANYVCKDVKGSIRLMTKWYNASKNELVNDTSYIDVQDGKLQSSVNKQYRYYKPSTVLKNLKEYNEAQEARYEKANKWAKRVNDYAQEMANKYPSADVSIIKGSKRDYYGKYIDTRVVSVKFESGSYVRFNIPSYDFEKITVASIVDVQEETTEDKMARFATQTKQS